MSLESSVRECGASIGSSRATDRKKNGENLKDFLMGNVVPPLLTENTLQNKGYTWNDLFDDIQELVLKETEKYESSKTFHTTSGPLCANLLQLSVSGSIKGQAYIRCDKVIGQCLFILRDKRLLKAIGDAYLNLLYKQILTCDYYLNNITPTSWEELLDVCLSICISKYSKLDDYTKLRLLLLVMRNGKNCCQFVIPLRDSLIRLKQCFLVLGSDKKVQEVVMEIMILLLEALSTESRLTLCEFTESQLSSILKFYDQNLDQKKKSLQFKLYQLIVALHHPIGRTQQEKGSLANNWDVWNKYLHSILEVVCLEVAFLQKQRKQQENLHKHYNEFYNLAASVYFQIFSFPVRRDQEEGESSSKRQRVTYNRNYSFRDLVEELRKNYTPWLPIIQVFAKKYGHSIATKDNITLLSVLENLLTNTSSIDWNVLEELITLIVTNLGAQPLSKSEGADVLVSVWNSCVRTSALVNSCHGTMHAIIQLLLSLDILKYQNVQPLVKLYYERAMPVTDHSVNTLTCVFHKYFNKFTNFDDRMKCFAWLNQGQITSVDVKNLEALFTRLLASDNVQLLISKAESNSENLHGMLFSCLEKSILFSEFELDVPEPHFNTRPNIEQFEVNKELYKEMKEYFQSKFTEYIRQLNNKDIAVLDFMKFINVVLCFLNIMVKYDLVDREELKTEAIFRLLKMAVQDMYLSLTINLNKNTDISVQMKLLQCLESILMADYDKMFSCELRRAQPSFFECLNIIVNKKIPIEDSDIYQEDDTEMDSHALRHICICVLAAYCRKRDVVGRNEILDFILDPKVYNFTTSWDVNCALKCIEYLNGSYVEDPPLESVFFLMQNMCKMLFKSSEATYKLLRVFLKMMDDIWNLEKEKQNCYIMVRGYLQRCGNKYYPPHVAALVYECVAKIIALSREKNEDVDTMFMDALQKNVKGDTHSIRLYCSYILKLIAVHQSDRDIAIFIDSLMDIFVINVSERKESILKDEAANRTLTVLHTALALVRTKRALLPAIITALIQIQKDKLLDKDMIRKVLNKITSLIANKNVETYFNDNVLFILNFWFSKGNNLDDMPFYLFGFNDVETFLGEHYKWVIPADVLWSAGGIISNSTVFNLVQTKSGNSAEGVIEACIANIIALYIPYTVANKYNLDYKAPGKREWASNAEKVFESTTEILGADKWSTLFVENMSALILLVATHYKDYSAAQLFYNVDIPPQTKSYEYPKVVLDAILTYMGEVIEENILKYLCENQALTIFKALFQLWANVLQENIFEYKALNVHSFVTFLETIPLDCSTDAFVGNFACTSLAHAIKDVQTKDEMRIFVKALKTVLKNYLPDRAYIVRKAVAQVLSILMIKKDEGFELECSPLLNYLANDMKEYLKENEDVIDFISTLSQGVSGDLNTCSSKTQFLEKLRTYKNSLSCPSHETLTNMRDFVRINKHYVNRLCDDLNIKGFSDDCGASVIHQIICSLSNTLKSATDDKTIIEACNCLAEIGNYDLKTLVTVPPANTQRIASVPPKQYFATVVMTSLTEILFDENPVATNAVTKTLKRLFQYKEGKYALDSEEINKEVLIPLSSASCNKWADFKISDSKFKELLCNRNFWIPTAQENNLQWLTRVTSALLKVLDSPSNYLSSLQAVCDLKPNICKNILSPLLGVLLECSSESHIKALTETMNQFFKHMWTFNLNETIENSDDIENKKSSIIDQEQKIIVQYMLEIVNFVRLQRGHYRARPDRAVESLNYLRLDYDKVAWVATVADQNVMAIYYGELWAMAQNDGVPPASPEATTQLDGGENVQRIFRKCYVSIGEMDAIDGCGTAHLTSEEEKRKHLINTGQYSDALLLHDIALSCGGHTDPHLHHGVVKSLHKSGMHHLALQYIKSLPENDDLNDIKYECLSFLGDWSDFVDTRDLEEKSKKSNCNTYSIIKAFRYSCLKDCLNVQPTSDFSSKLTLPLNRAKRAVSKLCQNLNMENCQNVYKVLSKLHQFSDIEDYISVRSNKRSITDLLHKWQVENLPAFNDFKHLEALITQRSLVLEHAAKDYHTALKDIVSLQLEYAELSLSNERIQMAQRLLAVVKKSQNCPEVALVDSQLFWAKGQKDIALSLLRNIVANPSPDVRLNAISLRQYGIWIAESKRDNARDIINKYLKKSLEVLSARGHDETRLKVYYDIANFADIEYKQVVAYMNSSIYEKKVKCMQNMKSTVNSFAPTQQSLSKDDKKTLAQSNKFVHLEEAEIANTKAEKETFLHLAMRYYLLSLKQSESNNLSVFRVISLWLDNPGIILPESEGTFDELLSAIPSWKFICVLPQLAPRLNNERSLFADNLRKLIKRCGVEHPHHTLPILFNLKNSDKDKMILNASENIGQTQRPRSQEPRVIAAEKMVQQLANEHAHMGHIIAQMEKLCDATISLANYIPKSKQPNQKEKIPAAENIHKIGPLDAIPIPTVTIPISVNCKYLSLPTIIAFDNYFETVGGINCPKKIKCKGADGRTRILLIKGEDDLRQDAVMQQVFNIVNTLLENDPVTSRNKLLIRTYKVVPMSKKSGVLEWCEGTMPIGAWLGQAHPRYRPRDISPSAARQKMIEFHQGKSLREKLVNFLKILKEFRPVFHYFFTEHFLDPVTWYERRLAYTKSVASSSMIGYILGLGDRHVQNMLIDKKTAEVVHIDFGIAFDQGKTLPTPETIPFRLTQDIIAGFGSSGVEGIFRRSCEKTMQLLRDNQETLLTILEVLLCDPLYSWTITSKQQNVSTSSSGTNQASGSEGSLAKRALLSVSSKLSGTEGGAAGGVAVPGQVARLIQSATDPANLSRLFHGWQPYL